MILKEKTNICSILRTIIFSEQYIYTYISYVQEMELLCNQFIKSHFLE